MSRKLPLGSAERAVLDELAQRNGRWTHDDLPLYENRYWTLQLLSSLSRKGMVREVVPDLRYELTDEGTKEAGTGNPGTRVLSDRLPVHFAGSDIPADLRPVVPRHGR